MKRQIVKTMLPLLCAACLLLSGCGGAPSGDCCRINGETVYFVSEREERSWEKPLTALMEEAFRLLEERSAVSEMDACLSEDCAAIAAGYACGLLDVTRDGVPELLIHPFGYFGSSGSVNYFIYDIYTGDRLGDIRGGMEESWCVYYDTQAARWDLVGQYWLRIGWSGRERYIETVTCDADTGEYSSSVYLHTSHQIGMTPDFSAECYPDTVYEIGTEGATMDDYYTEYHRFVRNRVRIPETELQVFRWSEVAQEEDSPEVRYEKMVQALIGSTQKFPKP